MERFNRLKRRNKLLFFLLANPNADYYLTFCFVCQEKAKPGHHHIKNYGAIVCFSCRAFWRRANQVRIPSRRQPDSYDNIILMLVEVRRRELRLQVQRELWDYLREPSTLSEMSVQPLRSSRDESGSSSFRTAKGSEVKIWKLQLLLILFFQFQM